MHGTCLTFYGLRALTQATVTLPYPKEGFLWYYPGFPSLYIHYGETPDFWWSGHIGFCFIMYLEFRAAGWIWWSYFSLFVLVYTFAMLTITRFHYSVDMIAGLIIGHYLWIMYDKYVYFFDYHVLGIPLHKRLATP